MNGAEYKGLIERVKICLRSKRSRNEGDSCTMNEILQTFSQSEKRFYKLPSFLQAFYKTIKVS